MKKYLPSCEYFHNVGMDKMSDLNFAIGQFAGRDMKLKVCYTMR